MSKLRQLLSLRLSRLEIFLSFTFLATAVLTAWVSDSGPRRADGFKQEEVQVKAKLKSTFQIKEDEFRRRVAQNPGLRRRVAWTGYLILLVAAGILWAWLRLGTRLFLGRPTFPALGAPAEAAWGFRNILRIVLAVFVVAQVALLAQKIFFLKVHPAGMDRHMITLGNTLLIDLAVLLLAGFFFLRSKKLTWDWVKTVRSIRFGINGYLTFLPVLGLLVVLVAFVLQRLKIEPAPQPIFTMYLAESRGAVLAWMLFLVTVIGPVAEEVFFRGLLYGWLRFRVGIFRALFLSAFLFSALHADRVAFVPIMGLGLLFGWVYERTGSLWAPTAIHVFHNGAMLYLASLIKELIAVAGGPG